MDNFRDSYFQVDWDLTTKRLKGTYWGKQYDTGRGFAVTVINGGQVVTPSNEVLRLKWEKPDNTTGYVNATIVNGKFIVENIDQMFTVYGSVRADFELSVGGEFVASITFYVNVEKAVAVDAIESSSDFTALQNAVGSVDSLQRQFNNVVANVTVDSEVIAARGTKSTLGARLDSTLTPSNLKQGVITGNAFSPIKVDTINKELVIPSGFRVVLSDGSVKAITAETIDLSTFSIDVQVLYDTITQKIVVRNSSIYIDYSNYVFLGSIYLSGSTANRVNLNCNFYTVNGKLQVPKESIETFDLKNFVNDAHIVTNGKVNINRFGTDRGLTFHGTTVRLFHGDQTYEITQRFVPIPTNAYQLLIYDLTDNQLKFILRTGSGTNYSIKQEYINLGSLLYYGGENLRINNIVNQDEPYLGSYKVENNGFLKDYLIKELDNVMTRANKTKGDFKFAFGSDIHVSNTYSNYYKARLLSEVGKYGSVNFVSVGGDLVDGFESHDDLMLKLTKVMKELKGQSVVDTFICQGNHDTDFVYFYPQYGHTDISSDTTVSLEKWHNLACKHLEDKVHFDSENPKGGYYYKDYNEAKVRVIVMNTTDNLELDENGTSTVNRMTQKIGVKQLNWLHREALNFSDKTNKDDWGIITISHVVPTGAENGSIAQGIFNAYFRGESYTINAEGFNISCDFTTQGAMEFICSVGGHRHYDYSTNYTLFPRPMIHVLNFLASKKTTDLPEGALTYDRVEGEISAEALDIFTIDKTNRKIYATRFGAGLDRVISY